MTGWRGSDMCVRVGPRDLDEADGSSWCIKGDASTCCDTQANAAFASAVRPHARALCPLPPLPP